MSDTLATYSFLPWLRKGLANNILEGDNDTSVILRASIPVRLSVSATNVDGSEAPVQFVEKTVELYGPGDIVGIDSKAIVKVEPRNWITNFEPNYLPYIEFYDEDFPWRYTPAKPSSNRLRPWITLAVLKTDEFEEGTNMLDKPLPFFKIKDGISTSDIFPKPTELWAWAHVHVNTDLSNGAAPNTASGDVVTSAITDIINENPDYAYSRIVSPRKLDTNSGYYAFLIPTFESGRLAGLGYDIPSDLVATECSWDNEINIEFPYYYRWYFKTGNIGDFEYLVNLLEPRVADKRVGVRDIDVLHPGSNLPPIDDTDLNGILKLGGALRVPFDSLDEDDKLEVLKYDEWDENPYPHAFTKAIATRINLADDYTDPTKSIEEVNEAAAITLEDSSGDPDPVITLPLYGRWHALQQRLLKDNSGNNLPNKKNWVHELNLDPRFRVAAGLGTKVVQTGQEVYMQAAWEQVGKIVAANAKIRMAQLAKEVSSIFYNKHLTSLLTERAFVFVAPVQKRVMYQNLTVHTLVKESIVPKALTSGTFRSIARPRGTVMKKLPVTENIHSNNLVDRINRGKVVVAPPRVDPSGGITLAGIAKANAPKDIPPFLEKLIRRHPWSMFIPFFLFLIIVVLALLFFKLRLALVILAVAAVVTMWLYRKLKSWEKEIQLSDALSQDSQTPEAVNNYPLSPDFVISEPGSGFIPSKGSNDSLEAKNFKTALKDVFTLVDIKFTEPELKKLDLDDVTRTLVKSLDPAITIPKRILSTILIPGRILDNMVEKFTPVMAYPEIDVPMYKPLVEMSSELFLPNINLIPQNSITLLENNQKFIESYLVGINHEMSRELLWREYPTDQRGTYFRQFWDVSSFLPPQPVPDDIKETLRDIPAIHVWSKTDTTSTDPSDPSSPRKNELGQHNQRALASGKTQLVLVIRGELLKKYPTAVVYAHKADWGIKDGVKDVAEERVFVTLSAAEELNPPATKIKTPLFEAKVEPDIYFFGFDLDDEEARGTLEPNSTSDEPGWFFVIKERPGEPRFGLDIEKATAEGGLERIINWNNLSWIDVETPDGQCIELNKTITFDTYDSTLDQENKADPDDIQAKWNPNTNAAEVAYILYQVPVLVGVHASRMLPN